MRVYLQPHSSCSPRRSDTHTPHSLQVQTENNIGTTHQQHPLTSNAVTSMQAKRRGVITTVPVSCAAYQPYRINTWSTDGKRVSCRVTARRRKGHNRFRSWKTENFGRKKALARKADTECCIHVCRAYWNTCMQTLPVHVQMRTYIYHIIK